LREQHAGDVALRVDNNQYLAKCREVFSVMRSTRTVSYPIVSNKTCSNVRFRALKAPNDILITMISVSRFSNLCKNTPGSVWQKICLCGLTWDASTINHVSWTRLDVFILLIYVPYDTHPYHSLSVYYSHAHYVLYFLNLDLRFAIL